MVQIIPRAKGGLEQFLEAMSSATRDIGEGIGNIKGAMNEREERNALAERFGDEFKKIRNPNTQHLLLQGGLNKEKIDADKKRKLQTLKNIQGTDFWKNATDVERNAVEAEILGDITGKTASTLINAERERTGREAFKNAILGTDNEPGSNLGSIENLSDEMPQNHIEPVKKLPKRNYDAEISKWQQALGAASNPSDREFAKSKISELQGLRDSEIQQRKSDIQEKQFGHKETTKYAENIAEDADQARNILHANKGLREAIKKGKTGLSARNAMYKYLVSQKSPFAGLFQDKDTQAVINSQKALSGGFKKLFGSKPTEREFFWYENILPDLFKSGEVNESIADYYDEIAQIMLKSQSIMDEIVKKNGGYRPIDIDSQVREKMKPELDKLVNNGEKLSGYVMMRAPDGQVRRIPKSQLQAALEAGGEEI